MTLQEGPWRCEVFDPRPDPWQLGARYVHGGYVALLSYDGEELSGRASAAWDPYVGQGLPEVFEYPLGWGAAGVDEPYLRIGVGMLRRSGRDYGSGRGLERPVGWEVLDHTPQRLRMRCIDRLDHDDASWAYRLERELRLDAGGLTAINRLHLACPWSEPVVWFAHPFFACERGDAIGVTLPAGAEPPAGLQRGEDGCWRLGAEGGFGVVTGVTDAAVDLRLNGLPPPGSLHLGGDFRLDKLVVYGTARAFSIEPYRSRAWANGEQQSWQLRYETVPG